MLPTSGVARRREEKRRAERRFNAILLRHFDGFANLWCSAERKRGICVLPHFFLNLDNAVNSPRGVFLSPETPYCEYQPWLRHNSTLRLRYLVGLHL